MIMMLDVEHVICESLYVFDNRIYMRNQKWNDIFEHNSTLNIINYINQTKLINQTDIFKHNSALNIINYINNTSNERGDAQLCI